MNNLFKIYKNKFKLKLNKSQWTSDSNYTLLLFEEIILTEFKEFFHFSFIKKIVKIQIRKYLEINNLLINEI